MESCTFLNFKWFHTICIIVPLAFFHPTFLRYFHIDTFSSSSFILTAA